MSQVAEFVDVANVADTADAVDAVTAAGATPSLLLLRSPMTQVKLLRAETPAKAILLMKLPFVTLCGRRSER
jgi:hypothetical protein